MLLLIFLLIDYSGKIAVSSHFLVINFYHYDSPQLYNCNDGKTLHNKVKKNMIHVEKTKQYTVYIFSMDYNKDLPIFYNNHFRFFSRKLPKIVKQHNGLLEKSHIKWFSFDDMWREKKSFRRFYQTIIDRILDNEDVIIKSFANKHK